MSLSVKKTGCRCAESWACLSQAAWKGAMSCGGMRGDGPPGTMLPGGGGLGWDIVALGSDAVRGWVSWVAEKQVAPSWMALLDLVLRGVQV